MRCPTNTWELWTDGSHRLTTNSDLLHLIVWHEDALKPSPGWHWRVIQGDHAQLKHSKSPSPTAEVAKRACEKAALTILNATLKAFQAGMGSPTVSVN